jgi:hypothetical protein
LVLIAAMSLTEIQASLEKASLDENLVLLGWLRQHLREKLENRSGQLSEFHREIDRGERASLEDLRKLNRALDAGQA